MMKKITLVFTCLFIICSLCACSNNSDVVGTWSVSRIEYNGQSYSVDEMQTIPDDVPASTFADWSKAEIKLTASGKIFLERPSNVAGQMETIKGSYTVGDNFIELISPNDKNDVKILDLNDGELRFELPNNAVVIFSK